LSGPQPLKALSFLASFRHLAAVATLTLDLNTVVAGGTPSASTPWVQAVLKQDSLPNSPVYLTLTAPGLRTGEYLPLFFLNYAGSIAAADFTVAASSGLNLGAASVSVGANSDSRSGGNLGKFDLQFAFQTANSPAGGRFQVGDSITYQIDHVLLMGFEVKDVTSRRVNSRTLCSENL